MTSKRSIASVLARGLTWAVLGLLFAVFALATVPRLVGYETMVVRGGSMGVSYPVGSLIVAATVESKEIALQDVIVVQEPGAALAKVHRVIALEERDGRLLAVTKGDANKTADPNPYELSEQVLTPRLTIPVVGRMVAFFQSTVGWLLVILVPAVALTGFTLRRIWREGAPAAGS